MAVLIVRRDKGYADKLRKYRILLDGLEIGRLADGGELRQDIQDGPHLVQAKVDWCGSQPIEIDARGGEQIVVVRSALRGWRTILAIYYVLFYRRGYLKIELQQQNPG